MVERALTQLTKFTASDTHRLDRAIVSISVDPEPGTELPGTLLRECADEIEGARLVHYVTAFRPGVVPGRGAFSAGRVDPAA
ncbi:hypothetical protein [Streptomyces sp. Wb2n-11]|uniref:hypothetical protein n=1 Tax=Streptomyces sp. Wb2n-11 TaxID=1030533 RepID=UPI000A88937F|nr:hypothetical protein [Streptomyces sp. Wb2n-11]